MARLTCMLCLLLCLLSCGRRTGPGAGVVLFTGGTILTMTTAQPEVEAVAVMNEKIVATGTMAYLKQKYPGATVHDLKGVGKNGFPWLYFVTRAYSSVG